MEGIAQKQVDQVTALLGGDLQPEKKPDPSELEEQDQDKANGADQVSQGITETEKEKPALETQADDDQTDSPEPGESQQEIEQGPPTLNDLARKLEMSDKDLYNVKVPMRGVEQSVTVGDLKDVWKQHHEIITERDEYDDNREQQISQMMIAERQLNTYIEIVKSTGGLSEQVFNQINEINSNRIQKEQRSLMTAIPAWRDPQTRANDLEDLVQFLGDGYGLTRAAVIGTTSAAYMRIAYDFMKLKNLAKDWKRDNPKPTIVRGQGRKVEKPKNAAHDAKIKAATTGNLSQKVDAVTSLLDNPGG